MQVVIVQSGESDAELGETQRAVVAPWFGADPSEVGNRKAHLVGSVIRSVIGRAVIVVEQVEGGGEFVVAVDAHTCRVDADRGHVATYGTHSIDHAQSFGRALVEGLRKQTGIIAALAE